MMTVVQSTEPPTVRRLALPPRLTRRPQTQLRLRVGSNSDRYLMARMGAIDLRASSSPLSTPLRTAYIFEHQSRLAATLVLLHVDKYRNVSILQETFLGIISQYLASAFSAHFDGNERGTLTLFGTKVRRNRNDQFF